MAEEFSLRRSFRIVWKVKSIFSAYSRQTRSFYIGDSRCQLQLKRYGTNENERVAIYLLRQNSDERPLNRFRHDICIEDRNGKPQFSMGRSSSNAEAMIWYEYTSELRREGIFSTTGDVRFACELVLESDDESERDAPAQIDVNLQSVAGLECLSSDFHDFLQDTCLSDVTLKCGDRTISAHWAILCARSDVFFAMFVSNRIESRTDIIEISDMEPSTLDQLVQYIYSGRVVGLSAESVQQLYAAADKYSMDSLKLLCGDFMQEILTEENACSFLVFADARGDKDLKDYVLSFVVNTDLLWDEENWFGFHEKYPKLAAEVLHHVYRAKCPPNPRTNRIFPK